MDCDGPQLVLNQLSSWFTGPSSPPERFPVSTRCVCACYVYVCVAETEGERVELAQQCFLLMKDSLAVTPPHSSKPVVDSSALGSSVW